MFQKDEMALIFRNNMYRVKDRHNDKKKIRTVVFLIGSESILNGIYTIYKEMLARRIRSVFVVMSEENSKLYTISKKINPNSFSYRYKNHVIPLWYFKPDYVFYTTPYNYHYPKEYQIKQVSTLYKTCYTLYGIATAENENVVYNSEFFKYLYMFFSPNDHVYEKTANAVNPVYGKVYMTGYTKLDALEQCRIRKKDDRFTVIWNPRWLIYQKRNSNFFKYKDYFVEYFKKNKEECFIFRPHPMLFDHCLNKHFLTEKKLEDYKRCYQENRRMDMDPRYYKTFWNSDVLISDVSSLLVEYLYTGKPIIFCPGEEPLNSFGKKLEEGFYVANDFKEIEKYLEELKQGKDRLKLKREQIVKELISDGNMNASKRIVDIIMTDF